MTLTEILIASAIAVVVAMTIGMLDVTRIRMEEELKERSGVTSGRTQVALASFQLARELARADRLYIRDSGLAGVNPGGTPGQGKIQIRFLRENPATCATPGQAACYDDAANYRWDEYRITGDELEQFLQTDVDCSGKRVLANEVGSLAFRFRDEAPAPPGGEPFGADAADNNALEYAVVWDNGGSGSDHRDHEFHGLVESRPIGYSDVPESDLNPAAGDSGTGVDVTDVSDPPAPCP